MKMVLSWFQLCWCFSLCWWCFLLVEAHGTSAVELNDELVAEGLTVSMCDTFFEQADFDQSGGIAIAGGEYAEFIRLVGQHKCFEQVVASASGPQYLLFLNLVCNTLAGVQDVECKSTSEIPYFRLTTEAVIEVCGKVNRMINSECPPTVSPAPTVRPTPFPTPTPPTPRPTTRPPTPSPMTRPPSRAFAPGLSVSDCRIALTQAAATDAPPSNDNVLTLPEYSFFLERLGDSVCFEPDPRNFGLAREAAFARLQCEPLGTCQGTTTTTTTNNAADLTIEVAYYLDNEERLTEFCQNSWIWAMNGAQCAVPTVSPAPSSSAAPSGEVDTRSVTSAATPFRWSGRTNRFAWWSVVLLLSVGGFVVAER